MKLEVTIGRADEAPLTIDESLYWYIREELEAFAEETGITIHPDEDVRVEGGCLLELFLTLEPIAERVRASAEPTLFEVGLTAERDQITRHTMPREEGLIALESLMTKANDAYNAEQPLRIRGMKDDQGDLLAIFSDVMIQAGATVEQKGEDSGRFLVAQRGERGLEFYAGNETFTVDPSIAEELQGERDFKDFGDALTYAKKWLSGE